MNVRETSIEAFKAITNNGLLSKRRMEVYSALFDHGPCTGSELNHMMSLSQKRGSHANVLTRLGELRNFGVAKELGERRCLITGRMVIEWDVTDKLPAKFEKPEREKCRFCKGKGYVKSQQMRFNV